MPLAFSQPWSESLGAALNESERYASAASRWRGALMLVNADDPAEAAFLDLHAGRCREARTATTLDRENARFVLSAPIGVWRKVLDGELGAIPALLQRQIKVEKGRLTQLVPYTAAARELIACAGAIGTDFPDGAAAASEARVDPEESSRRFACLAEGGLEAETPPAALWRKAKVRGIWNPADVDLTEDRADWLGLDAREQRLLLQLAALFGAGEESVTIDLLPLIRVIAAEGRLEEEMYLTSFLWEEAKHVEAFHRFFAEVAHAEGDLSYLLTPSHRRIFERELPSAMERLLEDPSPVAQAEASTTYNMIVEGVLAETGYHSYYEILAGRGIMPGMQRIVRLLQADESRHLAYGVFLLSRLVAEHGEAVWRAIDERMEALLEPALGIVHETFEQYLPDVPFGLELDHFVDYAADQFDRRRRRIERARRQTLAEVLRQPLETVDPGAAASG